MMLPAQNTATAGNQPNSAQQNVIYQTQAELLASIQAAPDETMHKWQKAPLRLGDWSSTLEIEICHLLW